MKVHDGRLETVKQSYNDRERALLSNIRMRLEEHMHGGKNVHEVCD